MRARFLILFIVIVGTLLAISLFFTSKKEAPRSEKTTKKASLSLLVPGLTNRDDVYKKTGTPFSVVTKDDRTYLYYETKNSSFRDLIVLENGVELYAVENIFEDSELSLTSVLRSYGNYGTYYSEGPFVWYVFFEKGVAVETDEESILKVLYFIPQKESEFLANLAPELNLSKSSPTPEVLRP